MRTFLVLLVLAEASTGAALGGSDSSDALFADHGFPAAPGLTHLCGEHVSGSSGEITWDAIGSKNHKRGRRVLS